MTETKHSVHFVMHDLACASMIVPYNLLRQAFQKHLLSNSQFCVYEKCGGSVLSLSI